MGAADLDSGQCLPNHIGKTNRSPPGIPGLTNSPASAGSSGTPRSRAPGAPPAGARRSRPRPPAAAPSGTARAAAAAPRSAAAPGPQQRRGHRLGRRGRIAPPSGSCKQSPPAPEDHPPSPPAPPPAGIEHHRHRPHAVEGSGRAAGRPPRAPSAPGRRSATSPPRQPSAAMSRPGQVEGRGPRSSWAMPGGRRPRDRSGRGAGRGRATEPPPPGGRAARRRGSAIGPAGASVRASAAISARGRRRRHRPLAPVPSRSWKAPCATTSPGIGSAGIGRPPVHGQRRLAAARGELPDRERPPAVGEHRPVLGEPERHLDPAPPGAQRAAARQRRLHPERPEAVERGDAVVRPRHAGGDRRPERGGRLVGLARDR